MSDGLRDYIDLVTGITEATATRAKTVAAELLNSGVEWGTKGHTTVTDLADDLVSTGRDNREALIALIRAEVEKTAARVGFVTEDEVAVLRERIARLEREVSAKKDRKSAKRASSSAASSSGKKVVKKKVAKNSANKGAT